MIFRQCRTPNRYITAKSATRLANLVIDEENWIGVVIEPTSGVPVLRAACAERNSVSKIWLIWWMTSGLNCLTISSIRLWFAGQ